MARTNNLTNFLTDVASAIKTKTGDSTAIPASQFDTKIAGIKLSNEEYTKANNNLDEILYQSQNVLPDTYQQVEYLESTGTQYLTIPYTVNNKTRLYCRYNQTDYGSDGVASVIFGVTSLASASSANNGIVRVLGGTTNSLNRVGWGGTADGTVKNISGYNIRNNWYKIFFDLNEVYIDDTLVATLNQDPNEYWSAEYGLGIFARNGRSVTFASKARISSLWVKEDDYMINLIPCYRKSDNEAGMYDTVNNVFYTNDGTGEFEVGADVDVLNTKIESILTEKNAKILSANIKNGINILGINGAYVGNLTDTEYAKANADLDNILYQSENVLPNTYQEVEYLEASGTQYIDTGVNGDCLVELDCQGTLKNTVSQIVIGSYTSRGSFFGQYLSTGKYGFANNEGLTNIDYDERAMFNIHFSSLQSSVTVNNQTYTVDVLDPNENNYTLFRAKEKANRNYYYANAKIYSCKFSKDGILVRNFVPCYRKADNEAGMYDTVNDVFYTNQGTGDFVVGENVDVLNSKIESILTEKAIKLIPENIKSGVNILGIIGTYTGY